MTERITIQSSSLASMIQIAALDTHSNTMVTVQNRDVTQHKVDCEEAGLSDHKPIYGELADRVEHWGVTTRMILKLCLGRTIAGSWLGPMACDGLV